jgi:hypothetical protein
MANIGQSTFVGSVLVIQCDSAWNCCQREQAANKVQCFNDSIEQNGPLNIRTTAEMDALKPFKKDWQSAEGRNLMNAMENSGDDAKAYAEESGAPTCLGDEIKDKTDNQDAENLVDLDVQMDHPVDVKFGGDAAATLIPLDTAVNNAFGMVSRWTANDMLDAGEPQVTAVALYCPPDEGCASDWSNAGAGAIQEFLMETPDAAGPVRNI